MRIRLKKIYTRNDVGSSTVQTIKAFSRCTRHLVSLFTLCARARSKILKKRAFNLYDHVIGRSTARSPLQLLSSFSLSLTRELSIVKPYFAYYDLLSFVNEKINDMAIPYNLKKPEEVKEYLKNLHIEYKFGCYSEKNPEGKGCKKDINEAYKYEQKACNFNDDNGCLHGGILAITDQLEDDPSMQINKGINMLNKACYELHSEKACFFLSGIYMSGIENHVEKNFKEAYKLSLKSCEYGNPYACANVSQMHLRGDGVKKDSELAKIFRQRADQLLKELKHVPTLKFQQGIEN
ncbi:cytochrome c oxidase assembly factor 7 homolog isoform X2 [Vespa mandarinia]|uniref:cytochrome c oxidase assembly factor 7 homolog isoform X2 n=1 Tax=Vespa mandarinia TaxID=7446 RepID=UPI0016131F8F|nr:cytochrome c oxidase assembly factor 7 homolog isoform X2 [Vespa mandarinia]